MTGFRLPVTAFRKLNVWLGFWEKSPPYKLCTSWRRFIYPSHQPVAPIHQKPIKHGIFPVNCYVFLRSTPACISAVSVRLKSNKNSKKNIEQQVEDEEEEEERSDSEDEFEDDPSVMKNYKDLEKVVPSFRFDIIMKAGLDIARNKVEDAFYNSELRLNGEKLWKKSRAVKVGDTLDFIVGEDKETETAVVMRIVLKKASEKTESDKYKVVLRRWKSLKVPKQDVFK
uniref:Mitochondrial transcription rescue factor 1 n=1 Tax=Sphenodon punctatus TaxID=8508 RepID=A0A8D0GIE0_SPHPU